DFDNRILRAFRRSDLDFDGVRVQDVSLSGASDDVILEFAAENQRVVLTRDVSTMTAAAFRRVERETVMPGLIVIPHRLAIGRAINELVFLASESKDDEWKGQILYLPL